MQSKLMTKVEKLNDYCRRVDMGEELNPSELNDQKLLRDDILNFIKFAIGKERQES